tara:strand:+ start:44 stop:253 length:210 start_codon:yes stop_codon:yes gene_type:complete
MKVVFENAVTVNSKTDLIIDNFNDIVNISIEYTDFTNNKVYKRLGHNLTKDELKEFIGALLHIQSKIRK